MAACATLADLGGEQAADVLASRLEVLDDDERAESVEALAWLGDKRAIEPLHELVMPELDDTVTSPRRGVLRALARIGFREDLSRMVDAVGRVVSAGADAPGTPGFWRAQRVADQLWLALYHERPEFLDEAGARLREAGPQLPALARWQGSSGGPRIVDVSPVGERVAARTTLAELNPLIFFGQLPVTTGGRDRTAYVFVDPEGNHWEPLGEANAVVMQPGSPCQLETAPLSAGPQLFESVPGAAQFRRRSRARPYERFVRLEDGLDPERWEWPELAPDIPRRDERGDWNKLGGTPLFLQGEQTPPGEGWSFAFQFSAAWAGRELADGAECYGFVREDGAGAFLWQCH